MAIGLILYCVTSKLKGVSVLCVSISVLTLRLLIASTPYISMALQQKSCYAMRCIPQIASVEDLFTRLSYFKYRRGYLHSNPKPIDILTGHSFPEQLSLRPSRFLE